VITKAIIEHVEEGRFLLLEKLVNDLVGICSRDPAVNRAMVTVDKPHALRFADSVSLTLVYDRDQMQSADRDEFEDRRRHLTRVS
jgi:D-erythro-7,8-dihydroneopterin triphosphate epimerase